MQYVGVTGKRLCLVVRRNGERRNRRGEARLKRVQAECNFECSYVVISLFVVGSIPGAQSLNKVGLL